MPVYILASIAVSDWAEYEQYQAGFMDVFARYEGEVLAVSDAPVVVEGEWPYTRAVVLRFPDADEARRWYESPEYVAIAKHRHAGSSASSIIILDGFQ